MRRSLAVFVAILHLGTSRLVRAAEGANPSPKPAQQSQRWHKSNGELVLKDIKGAVAKRLALKNEENTLAVHPEHKFTEKKLLMMKAGTSKDGNFAWVDRKESMWLLSGNKGSILFQYYNERGEVLWEKTTVTGVTLSDDGKVVGILEADPKAIAINDHGNTFARPSIVSSSGELLLDLRECQTYSNILLSQNGRFGTVRCTENEPKYRQFHILFNVEKKLKKELSAPSVEVHEDGTYTVVSVEQEFDPKTKKYGGFVRKVISHGRIE